MSRPERSSTSRRSFQVILNPAAASGHCQHLAAPVFERLEESGLELEIRLTSAPRDALKIARQSFAAGHRDFVAVGGDGTVFEVLNGFLPSSLASQERCSLAPLPLGTGNSFVNDTSEKGVDTVVAAMLSGRSRPADVIRYQEHGGQVRYALGQVALGFPGRVVDRVLRTSLKRLGAFGYTVGVLLEVWGLSPIEVGWRIDDGEPRTGSLTFLVFSNCETIGGNMRMAPGAEIADGRADLVLVEPVSRLELLRTLPKIYSGRHLENPHVHLDSLERLELSSAGELDVLIDGELFRERPAAMEIVADALDVLV